MFRRRILLGAVAVALLGWGGFFLFLWLTSPTPGVTWDNFHRLRVDMSARDVEALLGKPNETFQAQANWTVKVWRKGVIIQLSFAGDRLDSGGCASPTHLHEWGKVEVSGQVEPLHKGESFLDRIRRWLRL